MRRTIVVLAVLASSLFAASSAYAFDCIRVSASHQGSVKSANHSGRWLRLWTTDQHYLINVQQVVAVTELGEV